MTWSSTQKLHPADGLCVVSLFSGRGDCRSTSRTLNHTLEPGMLRISGHYRGTPLLSTGREKASSYAIGIHSTSQVPLKPSNQSLPILQDDEVVYRIGCLCFIVLGSHLHLRPASPASLPTPSYHPGLSCRSHLPRSCSSYQHHPSRPH